MRAVYKYNLCVQYPVARLFFSSCNGVSIPDTLYWNTAPRAACIRMTAVFNLVGDLLDEKSSQAIASSTHSAR